MTISQPSESRPADIVAEIDSLHAQMCGRAGEGRWAGFAELLARRNLLLERVADVHRAGVLASALRCNETVLECALADRDAVAERVDGLEQRRAVGSFYRRHGGSPDPSS